MAIKSLDEILVLVIQWEKSLRPFYGLLEKTLVDDEAKTVVQSLQQRFDKGLAVLDNINVEDYRNVEFIKNVPDYRNEYIVPNIELNAHSGAQEILGQILAYEEILEEFYERVLQVLVYTKSKELFSILVQFKFGQIKEIRRLMDGYVP